MVIMARARKNRKQWRPKAAIESAAAQHRTNVNHLVTTFLQDRHDTDHPTMTNTTSKKPNEPSMIINESVPLTNTPDHNVLMLQLSTPGLSPAMRTSINITSSSGEQLDDDERDDIALFVHHEQQKNYKNNKDNHDNQIEILPSPTVTSIVKFNNSTDFKTTTRSSQTENHHHSHYPTKRFKTRLKTKKPSSDVLSITTSATQANNTKIAKRKAYSRMKKERKATQTLIIVLSMTFNNLFLFLSIFVKP